MFLSYLMPLQFSIKHMQMGFQVPLVLASYWKHLMSHSYLLELFTVSQLFWFFGQLVTQLPPIPSISFPHFGVGRNYLF
uniref:Uncharacterized protein n=1 Tax=Rhizophora mucronata TaxID=61149 RepID=A0A2P2Q133_RHIMU